MGQGAVDDTLGWACGPDADFPDKSSFEHALDGLGLYENDAFVHRLLTISRACVLAAQSVGLRRADAGTGGPAQCPHRATLGRRRLRRGAWLMTRHVVVVGAGLAGVRQFAVFRHTRPYDVVENE
jgi:hypothetical protein